MHKIDSDGSVAGEFVSEDTATGRPPTVVTADWLNTVQGEILSVLDAAGVAPDKLNKTQLATAINFLIGGLGKKVTALAYSDMLGVTPSPVLRPTPEFLKALRTGTIKVVVVGDSISEAASTWYCNGWVRNFTELLRMQIPSVTWNVVNLAIGGRNLGQLADPGYVSPGGFAIFPGAGIQAQYWPTGTFKNQAWRDYVKDEAPDLIVMAHQENHGVDSDAMAAAWDSFYAYSQTWAKKPWYAVVSGLLPTLDPAQGAVYQEQQQGRQALADFWRHLALKNGYGLIDVNAWWRVLRDGVRRETVPFTVEPDFKFWGDGAKWVPSGAGATLAAGVMTFATPGVTLLRMDIPARDVDIAMSATPAVGAIVDMAYRLRPDGVGGAGYSVRYSPGTNLVELYYGITQLAFAYAPTAGATVDFRVRAQGASHEVYVDAKRILSVHHAVDMYAGLQRIGYVVGTGSITSMMLCVAQEYKNGTGVLTEQDLLGGNPHDIYVSSGDGIHHPSDRGIFAAYLPAVQQYLGQLKSAVEIDAALMQSCVGVGQVWRNMGAFRAPNVTYTNTGSRPIFLSVCMRSNTAAAAQIIVNGVVVALSTASTASNFLLGCSAIVPPGATYSAGVGSGTPQIQQWFEFS
jgi:hypothetical protein